MHPLVRSVPAFVVRMRHPLADERGSAPAEFVMVSALLLALLLAVLQLGVALHVRNTVTDAASEGRASRRSPTAPPPRALSARAS
ncbi:TadE/TadG family type IV pilus assembly protein [Arenivirga flava]|uniref:TadE-like domain-containing protein n=1 Tax=Arenivirga flava TaxID=1930060 RepID=A0AA37UGE4_9MICO|nr:hypothetical protein GCM10025874_31720 [Arenivirga flava]